MLDERQAADTTGVVARPGVRELLDSEYPVAIVTSCSLPLAHARLVAAALPVPATLVTPELTSRGKPDPAPYLLAARLLGAAPKTVWCSKTRPRASPPDSQPA